MRPTFLAAFAILGAIGLLSLDRCSSSSYPAATVMRSAGGVDGFELRHTGFGDTLLFPGNFSLGYAIWANYPWVLYRGEVYRRAGPGSVFVVPAQGVKPRYVVEETPVEPLKGYGETSSELVVLEAASGEVMARRLLRMGRSENGHGWAGQHAAEFLRKVLATTAPIGGGVRSKPYGAAQATLDTLAGGVTPPAGNGGADCPASYRVDKRRHSMALDAGAWTFVPQSHLNSFACHGDAILVESGRADQLRLDLLSAGGEHLFQAELRGELAPYGSNTLTRLRVRDGAMQVDFVHAPRGDGRGEPGPARLLRATVTLPPARPRTPSGELAVK